MNSFLKNLRKTPDLLWRSNPTIATKSIILTDPYKFKAQKIGLYIYKYRSTIKHKYFNDNFNGML